MHVNWKGGLFPYKSCFAKCFYAKSPLPIDMCRLKKSLLYSWRGAGGGVLTSSRLMFVPLDGVAFSWLDWQLQGCIFIRVTRMGSHIFRKLGQKILACGNSRFSLLLATGEVLQGGTFATQWQKFHADDVNRCSHNKSVSDGVQIANLFNFKFLLVDFGKVLCSSAK